MLLTVKRKLVLAFVIMAVLMAAAGGFSLHSLSRLNIGTVELLEEHQPILTHMRAIVSSTLFHSLKIDQYVATGNRAHLRKVAQLRQDVDAHIAALFDRIIAPQERQLAVQIREAFATYLTLSDTLKQTFENQPQDRITIQGKQMRIAALLENELLDKVNALYQSKQDKADLLMAANQQRYLYSIRVVLIASFFLTMLALTMALMISRAITGPIGHLVTISQRVAKGDLSARAHIDSADEIGFLARNFNTMTGQLQELIGHLEKRVAERTRELVEEKNFVTTILETADALVVVVDRKGRIVRFNKAAERITGYSFKEVRLDCFWDRFLSAKEIEAVQTLFRQLKDGRFPIRNESHWISRSGEQRLIDWSNSCILGQEGQMEYAIGIGTDITEHRQAELEKKGLRERAARSRKMEALGLLAGGVAHDLNNILSGIVNYPEMLLMEPDLDPSIRQELEAIKDSGARAAAVVSDLLDIARGAVTVKEPVNLNTIIREFWASPEFVKIKNTHPFTTFDLSIEENLFDISASKLHIKKALLNLVNNAAESIPEYHESGRVGVSAQNTFLDRPFKGYDQINEGEYIRLSVTDDGSGIDAKDIERIFEPFYTKKVMGRSGTGLGLAVVWNVCQDHYGYIDVKSDCDGSCFDLYFPVTRDALKQAALSLPMEKYQGRGEHILVIDDVEIQRDLACKMLLRLGYRPTAVASGEQALKYLEQKRVSLIVLDMILEPGISGLDTYRRILEIFPGQKAVIVSGYSENSDVHQVQHLGAGPFIKKPYTLETLGVAIKQELKG